MCMRKRLHKSTVIFAELVVNGYPPLYSIKVMVSRKLDSDHGSYLKTVAKIIFLN